MEHLESVEPTESTEAIKCSSKKGFARFSCNVMQAIQIVLVIFVAMIFMVIALDGNKAMAKSSRNNASVGIVVNPSFKYRFVYERELKSILLERTNKVRGSRVNLNIVLRGKDKNTTFSTLRKINFNIQEKAKLKRKFNQFQINPSKLKFADFVYIRSSMIGAFGKILSDLNGIAVISRKSKYMNIAKIMGLRVIPVRQIKRDQVLHSSAADNLR